MSRVTGTKRLHGDKVSMSERSVLREFGAAVADLGEQPGGVDAS